MQIDWFTFVAQLINFAVLLVLLQRFLYRPIARAMAEREANLAAEFEKAAQQAEAARQEAALFHEKRAELETQRTALLDEARQEAAERRRELVQAARAEADALARSWRAEIEREKARFLMDLRRRVSHEVFRIARQTLADVAQADLETEIANVLIARLENDAQDALPAGLLQRAPPTHITIRSAFPLPDNVQRRLTQASRRLVAQMSDPAPEPTQRSAEPAQNAHNGAVPNVTIGFDVAPDLISGIELQTSDYRISWSVRDYLDTLEANVLDTFEQAP